MQTTTIVVNKEMGRPVKSEHTICFCDVMCWNRGDCCEDLDFLSCEGKTSSLSLPHQELPCKIFYSIHLSVINLLNFSQFLAIYVPYVRYGHVIYHKEW